MNTGFSHMVPKEIKNLHKRPVNRAFGVAALCASMLFVAAAQAAPTVSVNSTLTIAAPERTMTFDGLTNGTPLTVYNEDNMTIDYEGTASSQVGSGHPGFAPFQTSTPDGFLYSGGGQHIPLTIRTSDGVDAVALEFVIGTGEGSAPPNPVFGAWETYRDSVLTGSGTFAAPVGNVVKFIDIAGFDEIIIDTDNVAMTGVGQGDGGTGTSNAIALDDVQVDIPAAPSVPEPGMLGIFGLGLLGLGCLRRRRR